MLTVFFHTGAIRYLVLDCGNDQAMDFFTEILDKIFIKYNCNYARDRLEGGIPRKPQLRIAAASVGTYARRIGFISTARMEILKRAMGSGYEERMDDGVLQGKRILSFSHSTKIIKDSTSTLTSPIKQKEPVTSTPTSTPTSETPLAKPTVARVTQVTIVEGDDVIHKVFGKGTVTMLDGNYITVDFHGTIKRFVFPDVFTGGFLKS